MTLLDTNSAVSGAKFEVFRFANFQIIHWFEGDIYQWWGYTDNHGKKSSFGGLCLLDEDDDCIDLIQDWHFDNMYPNANNLKEIAASLNWTKTKSYCMVVGGVVSGLFDCTTEKERGKKSL